MEFDMGKLFVGGISWDTDEERLRNHFKRYGDVVEAVIMKDRATGRARGFGFVVFADPAVAERVLLEKHTIDGRLVEAKRAVPRDDNRNNGSTHGSPGQARIKKIFVGGLASTVTENDLKKHFDKFGTITDVVVMYDHTTRRPRGFGFITFDSEDSVNRVLIKKFHELNGKLVEVKKAVPKELSPGPTVRSPIERYNYGMNCLYNFSNSFAQGLILNNVGGYGMRTDGRSGPVTNGHNNFPRLGSSGYGVGMNFEIGMSPNWGRNMNYNCNLGHGRSLNPYYSGSPSRYGSPMGYRGGNIGTRQGSTSPVHNALDNDGLNFASNYSRSNSFPNSGNSNFHRFRSSDLYLTRSTSPMLSNACASILDYKRGNLGYTNCENIYGNGDSSFRNGENSCALRGSSIEPKSINGVSNSTFTPAAAPYGGAYTDLYRGVPNRGDSTWPSVHKEFDCFDSIAYELADAATNIINKDISDSLDNYDVNDRRSSRGISA